MMYTLKMWKYEVSAEGTLIEECKATRDIPDDSVNIFVDSWKRHALESAWTGRIEVCGPEGPITRYEF